MAQDSGTSSRLPVPGAPESPGKPKSLAPGDPGTSARQVPWLLQYADFDYAAFMRRRNVRRLITFLIVAVALVFCYWLRDVFIPLAVALLIAYVLNPSVVWLERKGMTRIRAVATVFTGFFAMAALALVLLIPPAIQNVDQFVAFLRDPRKVDGTLVTLARKWNDVSPDLWKMDERSVGVNSMIDQVFGKGAIAHSPEPEVGNKQGGTSPDPSEPATGPPAVGGTQAPAHVSPQAAASAIEVASGIFGKLVWLFLFITLVPLYTFYFLLGLDGLWGKFVEYLPGTQRDRILRILSEIHLMVSAFFRGRLTICLIVSALTITLLMSLSVPYAVFLGLLGGFGVIIPFFPFVASFIPALLLMLAHDRSTEAIVTMTAIFMAIQGLEQFVLTPRILGKAVELHPVTILVGVFVMANLFGVFGALLAVPLTAIAKILGREFLLPYFRQLAAERAAGDELAASVRIPPPSGELPVPAQGPGAP